MHTRASLVSAGTGRMAVIFARNKLTAKARAGLLRNWAARDPRFLLTLL